MMKKCGRSPLVFCMFATVLSACVTVTEGTATAVFAPVDDAAVDASHSEETSPDGGPIDAAVSDAAPVADSASPPQSDAGATALDAATPVVDAGPPQPMSANATMPDFTLAAASEKTMCVTVRLSNAAPMMAKKLTTSLAAGSHHFIAYRMNSGVEAPIPTACGPLSGITTGSVPMIISQSSGDVLAFPTNTALKLEAHQLIRLEAHFVNVGSAPLTANGQLLVDGIDVTSAPASLEEANMAFWGTTTINVPAHSTATTPILFQKARAGTHGFALTTHQHRLGSRFRIWSATSASDAQTIVSSNRTPLAETGHWDAPPLYMLPTQLDFDGTNGLAFQCEWTNTTSSTVGFGESANSEMCFMWMYYWPSFGFDSCLNVPCPR